MKKLRQIIKKKEVPTTTSGYSPDHDTVVSDGDTDFGTVAENKKLKKDKKTKSNEK